MKEMFYALSAIGVMIISCILITQARKVNVKLFRLVLSTLAYMGLAISFLLMISVLITF